MEGHRNQIMCKAGCGHFGNPKTNLLCSVCYKNSDPTKHQSPVLIKPVTPKQLFRPVLKVAPQERKIEATSSSSSEVQVKEKKEKHRCDVCRKKLGLIPIGCRCGGMFCGVHRYSDKHDCQFDYRELGRQEVANGNPIVVAEKISKI